MRRLFVAGNWKMNTKLAAAQSLARAVAGVAAEVAPSVDVAVCPPFPYLLAVKQALGAGPVALGAQNAAFQKPGAFTGEVAVEMLLDVGCQWVILGHSERRQLFGDTDAIINQKVKAAIAGRLGVIFCLGELLAERQSGQTEKVLETQLAGGLADLSAADMAGVVLAYEPVWAIGTGVTATTEQAQSAHAFIRGWLKGRFGAEVAAATRIQYGGSVKPDNAQVLMSQPDVDGALVGGAALTVEQFGSILKAAAAVGPKSA